jgi:hypothetical protein
MRLNYVPLILSFFVLSFCGYSQETSKDVTITASGSGTSLETATQSALRSAIEQAFGAFISSKTEMLNDQIVADEMTSVSSGNIKSFEILNQAQLPDNKWAVTLKTIVSVDKLTSFVQAKGVEVEIKGGLFALNIKQQMLNEESEIKAIFNMIGILHENLQTSFDFSLKTGDPQSLDDSNQKWAIPIEVIATGNKNLDFCAEYFKNTLKSISLSDAEVETYKSLNKRIFPVTVKTGENSNTYYLRKEESIKDLNFLVSNWAHYVDNFSLISNLGIQFGHVDEVGNFFDNKIFEFYDIHYFYANHSDEYGTPDNFIFTFPKSNQVVGTFKWNDKKSLSEIEQLSGFEIQSQGVRTYFFQGGYVIYEDSNGHGIVASIQKFYPAHWEKAKSTCENLIKNGYSDWRLPTKKEIELISEDPFWGKLKNFNDSFWLYDTIEINRQPLAYLFSKHLGITTTNQGELSFFAVRSY